MSLMGFKFIRDMSREEMIEELIAGQRKMMDEMPLDTLKKYIIHHRQCQVTKKLIEEADLDDSSNITGFLGYGAGDD